MSDSKILTIFSGENTCCRPQNSHRWLGTVWRGNQGGRGGRPATAPVSFKGVTTPTPPPQKSLAPIDVPQMMTQTPSPTKKIKTENVGDQPVVVMVGGGHSWACPQCNMVRGQRMAVMPTYGRSTQEKPLYMPSAVFPHTIWIHCRGTKRNITDLLYFNFNFDKIVNKEKLWQNIHCIGFISCQTGRTNKCSRVNEYNEYK